MTPEQFVYWLQGFMEVANPSTLTETQTQQIKDHLNLVFDKQTPDRTFPQEPHTLPNTPYIPRWEIDPLTYRPICETSTSTTTKLDPIDLELDVITKRVCGEIEESHNKIFCQTIQVPPHMFGEGKQKKKLPKPANRGGLKC